MLNIERRTVAPFVTADLITLLVTDLRPVLRASPSSTLRDALLVGTAVSLAMFAAFFSLRVDLEIAVSTGPFWIKLAYAILLAALSWRVLRATSIPGTTAAIAPLLLPPFTLAGVVTLQAWSTSGPETIDYWFGSNWSRCPLEVAGLSVPMTVALLSALRRLAPTHLRVAGFFAGLLAGGIGAAVYSLACGETSPGFVLAWYSAGMMLPAGVGAAIAPLLLRW